jgi:hypothetical protein
MVISEKEKLQQAVEATILSFKSKTIERMIGDILQAIKASTDEKEIFTLQSRHKDLKDISRKINTRLGRVILK